MFDVINGLPVHPLVVHGVVVLLPLAVLGTIALAVRPAWRVTYGPLLVAVTAVGTVLVPVATSSGEQLERRVGDPGRHADLGDQLIWFVIPLLILVVAMVILARRSPTDDDDSSRRIVHLVAGLSVVAALATGVQVYRIGDSGAEAAWGGVGNTQVAPVGD